jgi:hypothetical protein
MPAIIALAVLMTPMMNKRYFRPRKKVLLPLRLSNIQIQKTGAKAGFFAEISARF